MVKPILNLPAEIDASWLSYWADSGQRLRDKYRAALTVQGLVAQRGYETEFVEINQTLVRVRKGRRMVALRRVAELLKAGKRMDISVKSEEEFQWERDEIAKGRRPYTDDASPAKVDIEDWTGGNSPRRDD
jgi:hypothetical protein